MLAACRQAGKPVHYWLRRINKIIFVVAAPPEARLPAGSKRLTATRQALNFSSNQWDIINRR